MFTPVFNFKFDFDIDALLMAYTEIRHFRKRRPHHNCWKVEIDQINNPAANYIKKEFKRLENTVNIPLKSIISMDYDKDGWVDWHKDEWDAIGCRINLLLTEPYPIEFENGFYDFKFAVVDVNQKKHRFTNKDKKERIILKAVINTHSYEEVCELFTQASLNLK